MSVKRNDEDMSVIIYCDNCYKEGESARGPLWDATRKAVFKSRNRGWRILFDIDLKQYFHYCPECRKEI